MKVVNTVNEAQCATIAYGLSADHLLDNKLEQLNTLLFGMYGNGADWFEAIGPEYRDNLVWLASDLASDCQKLYLATSASRSKSGPDHG